MEIRDERREGALVLSPRGRLDSSSSGPLEKALLGRLGAGETRLVVDLSAVDYISSAGLRVFLVLARRVAEAGGRLALCGLAPAVKQVFDLAGFSALFRIEAGVEPALAAVLAP